MSISWIAHISNVIYIYLMPGPSRASAGSGVFRCNGPQWAINSFIELNFCGPRTSSPPTPLSTILLDAIENSNKNTFVKRFAFASSVMMFQYVMILGLHLQIWISWISLNCLWNQRMKASSYEAFHPYSDGFFCETNELIWWRYIAPVSLSVPGIKPTFLQLGKTPLQVQNSWSPFFYFRVKMLTFKTFHVLHFCACPRTLYIKSYEL